MWQRRNPGGAAKARQRGAAFAAGRRARRPRGVLGRCVTSADVSGGLRDGTTTPGRDENSPGRKTRIVFCCDVLGRTLI